MRRMKKIRKVINKDFLKNPFHRPVDLSNPHGGEGANDQSVPPMSLATFSKIHGQTPQEEPHSDFHNMSGMQSQRNIGDLRYF